MIDIHNRTRKKYFNFENINKDLEEIISGLFSNTQSYFSGIQNVFARQKNIILESTKKYVSSVDYKVNEFVNSTLDNLYFGRTEDVRYEEVKTEKKSLESGTYYYSFQSVEEIISGKFYSSYSLNNKKPKRLWKWKDRFNYVEGLFKEYSLNGEEKVNLAKLRVKISKNYYLKIKHQDIYKKLVEYFSC